MEVRYTQGLRHGDILPKANTEGELDPIFFQSANNASHRDNLHKSQLAREPGKVGVKGRARSRSESK